MQMDDLKTSPQSISTRTNRFSLAALLLVPLVLAPAFIPFCNNLRGVAEQGISTVGVCFAYVLAIVLISHRRRGNVAKPFVWYTLRGAICGAVFYSLLIVPLTIRGRIYDRWDYEWARRCFELQQGFIGTMLIGTLIGAAVGGILGLALSRREPKSDQNSQNAGMVDAPDAFRWTLPRGKRKVGKYEQRVWMVCFWSMFIVMVLQALIGCFLISAFLNNFSDIAHTLGTPSDTRFVWWFANSWGLLVDCIFGVLLAPLAMFSFAKFRIGFQRRSPLMIWLLSRSVLALALLWSAATLWLESTPLVGQLATMLVLRILIFDLPVWLWLVGLAVIRFENRCSLATTPGLTTPN